MNASSQDVLQHLIKADTASAFNISVGDVNVTGISQVKICWLSMLQLNFNLDQKQGLIQGLVFCILHSTFVNREVQS